MSEIISPHYRKTLEDLAETLCTPERYERVGQMALFDNVVQLHPVPEILPPEAA